MHVKSNEDLMAAREIINATTPASRYQTPAKELPAQVHTVQYRTGHMIINKSSNSFHLITFFHNYTPYI